MKKTYQFEQQPNEKTIAFQEQKQAEYVAKVRGLLAKATGKCEKARLEKALVYLANANDSGRFGRVDELLSANRLSRKTTVSKQDEVDNKVTFDRNGKKIYVDAERKTNGGRIGKMIDLLEKGKDTLLIYSMDVCNSSTKGKRRVVEPVLMWFSDFYRVAVECGAIKDTNGTHNEKAIQVTSKKLFDRLCDYPIPYVPGEVYTSDDLVGIEW